MASRGNGSESLYATLGVSSTVTAEDVRKVYRKLGYVGAVHFH